MVKLTAELIEQAAQYTNAVRDRELDLRGERGQRGSGPGGCAERERGFSRRPGLSGSVVRPSGHVVGPVEEAVGILWWGLESSVGCSRTREAGRRLLEESAVAGGDWGRKELKRLQC